MVLISLHSLHQWKKPLQYFLREKWKDNRNKIWKYKYYLHEDLS